ncbi:ABC transporter ATP-binding protein [Gemella sp. GH3]|uniref:ATP-binding cassette domain-containing protein n=1 Tax=unclassified Gemella TaxID=2624949 RepID=UPI0015CFBDAF|nr:MULTISPECIES: ABC transporter ATP-binding protein [unclassified Gemella]MBF0713702.1 ABC transporter ATP-binding protein [Gemella sp. GH3.1]NYS50654.1 ABC transporter ATP-binding protein [Gemella sp. GH3]
MNILKITNLTYSYHNDDIIKDINIHIKKGEFVSIIGTSGAGKSTIFNIVSGIIPIQKGNIEINGDKNFIGKVSYMLQKDLLIEHKTVVENVALPLIINGENKKEALKKATKQLEKFKLELYKDKFPSQLSGGMKQRVALLRTIMLSKKLFLLDEAFSALDAITKEDIHNWYLNIHKQMNLSSLLITHDIDEAIALSDRIYILKNKPGQITDEIIINFEKNKDIDYQKVLYKKLILEKLKNVTQ